jgi:hypothetical protein
MKSICKVEKMANNDYFLKTIRFLMYGANEDYQTDKDMSRYINRHRTLMETLAMMVDELSEELSQTQAEVKSLKLYIKSIEEETTTKW